jgi:hypothetical protein
MHDKPYSKCGIGKLPTQSFMETLMPYSWTILEKLPVIINWTTNQESIKYHINQGTRGIQIKNMAKDGIPFIAPGKREIKYISEAFKLWSEALSGKIMFRHVKKLENNKGIIITAPLTYQELASREKVSAYSHTDPQRHTIRFGNGQFTQMHKPEYSIIVLPSDVLDSPSPNVDKFFMATVVHEIGHSIGLHQHTHEIERLNSLINNAERPDFCSIMDYDTEIPNSARNKCNKGDTACELGGNTAPGEVDIAIINARLKFEEELNTFNNNAHKLDKTEKSLQQDRLCNRLKKISHRANTKSFHYKPEDIEQEAKEDCLRVDDKAQSSPKSILDGVANSAISGATFGAANALLKKSMEYTGASERTRGLVNSLTESAWLVGSTLMLTGDVSAAAFVCATIIGEATGYVAPGRAHMVSSSFGTYGGDGNSAFNCSLKAAAGWVSKISAEYLTEQAVDMVAEARGYKR